MKEMIERLIADGWEWVVKNKYGESCFLYKKKPYLDKNKSAFECEDKTTHKILPCLFPDITFENSPIELKTLLVDDEELFEKQQEELKNILNLGYTHIVKDIRGSLEAVNEKEGYPLNIQILSGLINEKYKLYEVKDLVKKRKVKKRIWLVAGTEGDYFIFTEKPTRREEQEDFDDLGWYFKQNEGTYSKLIDIDAFRHFNLRYEDEPIELTYEVEE